MQLTKIILTGCAFAALVAGAQTNSPSAAASLDSPAPAETRPLTLEECVKLALEHNLDIQIQKFNPAIDQFNINVSYGAYDPTFKFTASASYNASPAGIIPGTTTPYPANVQSASSFTPEISGSLPSGLTYDITGPLSDRTGNSVPLGTHYNSSPGITLRQPLLKNLWIDNPRYQILLNKTQLKSDELGLRLQIMTTVNSVKAAYYNLVYARDNVQVKLTALKLAEQLLADNRTKVEVGALAALDEKQAQSQAATSKADLLAAEQALESQKNVLKGLSTDRFGEMSVVNIIPAEPLVAIAPELNLQESLRSGLTKRPDYLQAKVNLERQNITIRFTKNQLFPELDLTGSYGRNASDATFDSNLGDIANGNAPYYSAGVFVSIPLGNVAARNNLKSAKVTAKQLIAQLKKLEQNIVIAIDNDVKTIRSDYQRVQATREASEYAKAALEAEQKKLENGKSTSFVVLQLQSNLTTARSAEIRALADYNIAVQQLAFDDGTLLEKSFIGVTVK